MNISNSVISPGVAPRGLTHAANKPWHGRSNHSVLQRTGRKSILIADDDTDARVTLGELLQLAGHSVHLCADGVEALRTACAVRPDVILLDIEMPGISGYEVCGCLRGMEGFGHTRVYALSGLSGTAHDRRCEQEGFNGQLMKPLDISELEHLV